MTQHAEKADAKVLVTLAIVYTGICLFCAGVSDATVVWMLNVLWLLGPPANLVHGSELLWLFATETVVVFLMFFCFARTTRRQRRIWVAAAALTVWVFSGLFAFAAAW
jgi:hypothetical protein